MRGIKDGDVVKYRSESWTVAFVLNDDSITLKRNNDYTTVARSDIRKVR